MLLGGLHIPKSISQRYFMENLEANRVYYGGLENREYSYSRYWPGTSLQVRLMRGVFNDIPPHQPSSQASSSPKPTIEIWSNPQVKNLY